MSLGRPSELPWALNLQTMPVQQATEVELSLPRNEIAKATQYSSNRWTALTRFLDDGRLCMSNNAAERALRGIAVGRHNWPSRDLTRVTGAPPPSTR